MESDSIWIRPSRLILHQRTLLVLSKLTLLAIASYCSSFVSQAGGSEVKMYPIWKDIVPSTSHYLCTLLFCTRGKMCDLARSLEVFSKWQTLSIFHLNSDGRQVSSKSSALPLTHIHQVRMSRADVTCSNRRRSDTATVFYLFTYSGLCPPVVMTSHLRMPTVSRDKLQESQAWTPPWTVNKFSNELEC